jgi:nucleoid-associated protein EbfC
MGSGFAKKKKQMRELQEQFQKMQDNMKNMETEGQSGNGLVTVIIDGDKEIKKIAIKPECVDKSDIEGLQDLITAALQDAYKKLAAQPEIAGLPSLDNFPF